MHLERLTEWLTSAEGTGKAVKAILFLFTAVIVATHNVFAALGLPAWAVRVGAFLVISAFAWTLLNSYRRFAAASRLQRPDHFTLHPTGPASLFGRATDLDKLLSAVQHYQLVLLDGDSGCGKSALILSGLVPLLKDQPDGLLPIVLREWGDDWIRGPLAGALESLYYSLSLPQRESLDWLNPPDLAANAATLAPELETRLRAIFTTLGRRPLLVADQFDDYQSLHRHRFLAADGSWITPRSLAETNPFWGIVRDALVAGRLRLLVATRSDMAAGAICARFVGDEYATARTLPLVEGVYLRQILAAIAPSDLTPPVVSNPDRGWQELCDLLERDLKVEGAVLMQQVRTVLSGVRQLNVLTPRAYRVAGGVRGVEILAIQSALRRASRCITSRPAADHRGRLDTARALLGALVVSKGTRQRPKARHAPFSVLNAIAGSHSADTLSMLRSLQDDEVVRPAAPVEGENAWQLDHDYLVTAVLAEGRAANRWSAALDEGRARYNEAAGDWRRQWRALLPMTTLARLAWEYVRRRLVIRDASRYLLKSAIKPLLLLLCLALTAAAARVWEQDRRLTAEATRLIDRFGGSQGYEAVMEVWRGSAALRARVVELIGADSSRLERAANTRWALAQAGVDPNQVRAMVTLLRWILQHQPENVSMRAVTAYADLVQELPQADVRTEFLTLQSALRDPRYFVTMHELARAYASLALRLTDADIRAAHLTLLELLKDQGKAAAALYGYKILASRLSATDARAEVAMLRQYVGGEDSTDAAVNASAYAYLAASERLSGEDAQIEAVKLRQLIEHMSTATNSHVGAEAYIGLTTRLTRVNAKNEAAVLRDFMKRTNAGMTAPEIVRAYVHAVSRLGAQDIKSEAVALRTLFRDTGSHVYVDAYGALAARLSDVDAGSESNILLTMLDDQGPVGAVPLLIAAYPVLASRLPAEQVEKIAASLRVRIDRESDSGSIPGLLVAYGAVAAQAGPSEARAAATLLAEWSQRARSSPLARELALTYVTVTAGLSDADVNRGAYVFYGMLAPERWNVALRRDPVPVDEVVRICDRLVPRLTPLQARMLLLAISARVWSNTDPETVHSLTALCDSLVTRLDMDQARGHAADLRLIMERAGFFDPDVSWQYAATIARLTDRQLEVEASALLSYLAQDPSLQSVASLTRSYAVVARLLLDRKGETIRPRLIEQTLTLAGHPFLDDRTPLLDLLGTLAGTNFKGDLNAAVIWARRSYGIQPAQLRPM